MNIAQPISADLQSYLLSGAKMDGQELKPESRITEGTARANVCHLGSSLIYKLFRYRSKSHRNLVQDLREAMRFAADLFADQRRKDCMAVCCACSLLYKSESEKERTRIKIETLIRLLGPRPL